MNHLHNKLYALHNGLEKKKKYSTCSNKNIAIWKRFYLHQHIELLL